MNNVPMTAEDMTIWTFQAGMAERLNFQAADRADASIMAHAQGNKASLTLYSHDDGESVNVFHVRSRRRALNIRG